MAHVGGLLLTNFLQTLPVVRVLCVGCDNLTKLLNEFSDLNMNPAVFFQLLTAF